MILLRYKWETFLLVKFRYDFNYLRLTTLKTIFNFSAMSEIKYKIQILAAIDHLRARKSRPDINRICKFMLKWYKVTPRDTKADLNRCLKEKSIFKVDYKDNVSYRNAAKLRKNLSNSKFCSTLACHLYQCFCYSIGLNYQEGCISFKI